MDQMPNAPFQSSGGPQFGNTEEGGWGGKSKGWLSKYGSSVILPIIALLILAGGIYLYAKQKTGTNPLLPEENVSLIQELPEASQKETKAETEEKEIQEQAEQTETQPTPSITQEKTIQEIIPQTGPKIEIQTEKKSGAITEKAVKGEGITHLARRALKDYLKDNPKNLTNEHKIFIEDYLKDKTGSRQLEIGEEISFSENIIEEAINASAKLNAEQLKNLEKYSTLVNL